MDKGGAIIEFLLLSEDSSKAWPTVQQNVVRKLLGAIDPAANLSRVSLTPLSDQAASDAMRANRWRSTGNPIDAEKLRILVRSIATHLAGSHKFCSFHYDGDRPWRDREGSDSDARFASIVRDRVRGTLMLQRFPSELTPAQREERVQAALDRLLPIVPYYSIEAWLFQNTDGLRDACRRRSAEQNVVEQCDARCDEWAADRTRLDEIEKVKECVCAKDTANRELAETLSNAVFAQVLAAGKSLAQTRDRWAQCESLLAHLERTQVL